MRGAARRDRGAAAGRAAAAARGPCAPVPREADRRRGGLPGRRGALPRARAPLLARGHAARARRGDAERSALARRGARDLRAARRDAVARACGGVARRGGGRRVTCAELRHREHAPGGSSARSAARRSPSAARPAAPRTSPGDAFCGECGAPLGCRGTSGRPPARRTRGRAPARLGALRRPRRLHRRVREPRRRGDARAALPLLRHLPAADRALRRDGREVHRRRGDGRLGHADRDRGRRRARRPRRARPRRRGLRARRRGRRARACAPAPAC